MTGEKADCPDCGKPVLIKEGAGRRKGSLFLKPPKKTRR
jgi:ssDNA-binding Zn-finger/Zn-ribbon topoisomerase 1